MTKLKNSIKVGLGLIIIIGLIIANYEYGKANYNTCINNGVDAKICQELLD